MKMNQIFRRTLSMLLCLCMLLSVAVTAFAEPAAQAETGSPFESTKTLTNGGDTDPETYTIDIDAIVTGKASEQTVGAPLDVAIVFDRSDSMSFPADVSKVKSFTSYSDLESYLGTLDTNVWEGYYRANNVTKVGGPFYSSRPTNAERYVSWEAMRYNETEKRWEVFQTTSQSGTNYESPHGVIPTSNYGFAGYFGYWVDMKTAYNDFQTRKKACPAANKDNIQFSIAISRLTMAQLALENFVTSLNEKAKNLPAGQNHTVSVISFGGTLLKAGYKASVKYPDKDQYKSVTFNSHASEEYSNVCSTTSVALTGENTTAFDGLLSVIKNQYVYHATATDLGMQEVASNTAYLPAQKDGRNRVVILLTDGTPTTGIEFKTDVANPAIEAAKELKEVGVTVFSLSFMEGVEPGTGYSTYAAADSEEKKAKDFLHLISSNYPGATNMTTPGEQAASDNFMSDKGQGEELMGHFASILEKVTTNFESPLAGEKDSISIYDEITREFKVDEDRVVKVYVQKYLGNGNFGAKEYIGQHTLSTGKDAILTATNGAYKIFWDCDIDNSDPNQPGVDLNTSSIRLNWLDAKNAALRELDIDNGGSYPTYTKGYKIGLEIPIEVDRDNTLGGNNINTNTSDSGLYKSTTDDTSNQPNFDLSEIIYEVPNANVEAKFDTEVYDYFMDLEDLVANQNASVNSSFAKAIFAAMLEDPEALLEYLENNKNDYVNLGISLEDLYALIANAGSDAFTANGAQSGATFDFTLDQMLEALVTLTYTSNKTDSIGVAPFTNTSVTLNPNYYGPKYVVVDFDETVKTPLDKEGGLNPSVTSTNGKIEDTNICYDFRATYGNGEKSYLEKNYTTVGYQVTAINAPKAQQGNRIVDRNFYVIPANVMTYDDTFMTVTKGTWEKVGTYADKEQSHDNSVTHGYDPLYNTGHSTSQYHNQLQAVTVSKTNGTAQATFTINGTGFDIFARTGPDSGTLAVEVSADETFNKDYKTFIVDTYLADGIIEQVPVVRTDDLPYGTWHVRITAFYDSIFDHNYGKKTVITEESLRQRYNIPEDADFTFIPSESGYNKAETRAVSAAKKGQYNVYVDGFRVYNTLGTSLNAVAAYAYAEAGEGVANIQNINDALIDSGSTDAWSGNGANGVLFTAAESYSVTQGQTTPGIILGMEGALYVKQNGSKFYLYKDAALTENVQYKGANVYYRTTTITSPNGREYSGRNYFYDGGSASKPMLATQINEAFGGEMPLYYNAKYSQYGPEKEVYLDGTAGIAFKVGTGASKVMVSLRSQNNSSCTVTIYDPATGTFVQLAKTSSYVEMYYDITKYVSSEGYIYIKNSQGRSALCNIKTIGTDATVATVEAALYQWVKKIDALQLPVDDSAEIKHTLNLASDISLNYAVSKAVLADYDYSFLEVKFNGRTMFLEPEIRGEYGYFTVDGITAVDMTEELTAQLHLFLGEEEFVSEIDTYSVAQYAYAQMNKAGVPEELKAVCANLLRYGAQAQSFKGSENALADGAMTAEQKAYLTDLDTVSAISVAKALGDVENGIAWAGKSLVLDSKVAVKAIFDLTGYAGDMDALNLRVSYVNAKGEEVVLVVETAELYNGEMNYYAFTVDTLLATDMRSELSMALYEGETQVSETQIYSVESYCAGKIGAIGELGKALLAYSDAAKAFFAN